MAYALPLINTLSIMRSLLLTLALLVAGSSVAIAQQEPPHGMGELQAYAVFLDAYRGDDFQMAKTFGEWMLEAQPREIDGHNNFNLPRQFERMIDVYVGLANEESDPSAKADHLRQAEEVFDLAFSSFSEDEIDHYRWNMRLGRFFHEHHSVLNLGTNEIADQYAEAFKLDPERYVNENGGYFAEFLLTSYASRGDRERAFAMIEEIEGFASADLRSTINEVREQLFDSPEERIEFYESQLAEASDEEREQLYSELADLYDEVNNTEKATEMARNLYEMNPNYANTRKLADIYLADGNYQSAIPYLEETIERAETDVQRKETTLELAETYQQIDELQKARDYARRAINLDSNYGEAYMRMAAIYARTVSQCTGGQALEREDRTVYWLIIDYLEKAKSADSSLASNANNRIESYKSAMPTSEHKFFRGWETGDSFNINGDIGECYAWINETTTVR